ncbi:MAG: hypothetical protein PHS93_10000 [Candidatus Omnitrophica bacterium]|nr:hypothetical protein [Candidatus Omnitrophota bacterium]MDD5353482.1 hypothetical protein [Candidatus Omnitrophota bacterium]
MKVVINVCFGGFSLSEAVYKELGIKYDGYGYLSNEDLGIFSDNYNAYRSDPRLINAIEKVGIENSGGGCAKLSIVDIPEGISWEIDEYDGNESVEEAHRSWR